MQHPFEPGWGINLQSCLTISVYKVVSQKSIPTQILHVFLYISNNKGPVDGFVLELTFAQL